MSTQTGTLVEPPVEPGSEIPAFLTRLLAEEGPVERIDTHVSTVLLAGDRVLKLKRAVRFPYLDFSTPERRLAACAAELAVNRRTAPGLYRGVHRITRTPDGGLALDGDGPLVDAAVAMRRFPAENLFDRMAGDGRLTPALVTDLAGRLAAFHAKAEVSRQAGGAAAMADLVTLNDRSLRTCGLLQDREVDGLTDRLRARLARHADRLDARRREGRVRRCHGDLTLRNICLFEGVPTPFDALEFDERLATIDVLYDLAFVLMDLWHRGRPDLANRLFNRYLDATGEAPDAGLMPFLMAMRAVIRAHVTASQITAGQITAAQATAGDEAAVREARDYLALARDLLVDRPSRLVAIGGLSGSGKSTLAAALAPRLGAPPGARIVGSDRTRKRLHGVVPLTRLPPGAYAAAVSEQVYAAMRDEAARVLAGGASVVLDAVFDRPAEREAVEGLAASCGVAVQGLWLQAPLATLTERVVTRRGDPSDATPAILAAQARRDCGSIAWHRLDAGLAPERLANEALWVGTPAAAREAGEGKPTAASVLDPALA
ncbi:AAA family ATPase [Methylobacterium currus]|uniref:bifunctional aminoglycoside phosphotransferase/ATP-binding protein n=1 Tax=Methylobacterium currus TaxID=2051553 RepID=UPI001E5473B0|nr:bifunctional aminoglycoside phosphotransferase/ATP-binding protein [Methylobacterium currus]UHC19514.1 AAA family ATPase [Methylobacterium currus]